MLLTGYHGTNPRAANKILREGFKPDSWFAYHIEDARAFGGPVIFEVNFDADKWPRDCIGGPDWQMHHPKRIPPSRIREIHGRLTNDDF